MKKVVLLFSIMLFLCFGLVSASSYEWVEHITVSSIDGSSCELNLSNGVYKLVNGCKYGVGAYFQGDAVFNENMAVYYKDETSTFNFLKDTNSGDIKINADLSYPDLDYNLTGVFNTGDLGMGNFTFRASINYNGCGSWTPYPDLVNCGDTEDITVVIS